MPNPYIDNANRWRELSEIDYFSYFIKAWIPFNAWFRNAYDPDHSERQIINALKSDGNVVRSRIMRLLRQNDEEATEFKGNLARLHNRLENHELSNRGDRITFTKCDVGTNNLNQVHETYDRITYSVERGTVRAPGNQVLSVVLTSTGVQRYQLLQPRYDVNGIQSDNRFQNILSQNQRAQLIIRYQRINPRLEVNLLDTANGGVEVGVYRFCANPEHIFAGLMEIIYGLRCVLFHGEVVPTREINNIYEPAYHILRRFLQSIV
jgi:hypothetical protein